MQRVLAAGHAQHIALGPQHERVADLPHSRQQFGAHVLDLATGETVDWIYTDGWLAQLLDGGNPDE